MNLIEETILNSDINERMKGRTCYNLANRFRGIIHNQKQAYTCSILQVNMIIHIGSEIVLI